MMPAALLFVIANILSTKATDLEKSHAEKGVPTRRVIVYNHMLPEKNKWHISKGKKILCEGGPYSQWYSSVRTDCKLPSGSYSITCCDLRSNEGWSGGNVQITGNQHKLCHKFSFDAKKKCYTEKFIVARIPTPKPTPKPTPPLENTFHKCLKKTAKAITDSVPNVYKLTNEKYSYNIPDGGNDMYDAGNTLYIKAKNDAFHGPLRYNQLCHGRFAKAGTGDVEYFTCKETTSRGDIFFAGFRSKKGQISGFKTAGGTGADNTEGWIAAELKPFEHGHWWAYRKSMATTRKGQRDPSINQLILVPKKNWQHNWLRDKNDPDWHEVTSKSSNDWVSQILYVMWGGWVKNKQKAYKYDEAQIKKIISKVKMACQ